MARNAIVFTGNVGVGKSYTCNELFKFAGVTTRFKSSGSCQRVTTGIQNGKINFNGTTYTIMDSPGSFDNTDLNRTTEVDGMNLCNLVKTLEACESVQAFVYLFTDRFDEPSKLWFDRMKLVMDSCGGAGNIILVQNQINTRGMNLEEKDNLNKNNERRINGVIGNAVKYFGVSFCPDRGELEMLMRCIQGLSPIKLTNLVVPEICYLPGEEAGEPYWKVIADGDKIDEGEEVHLSKTIFVSEAGKGPRCYLGLFGPRIDIYNIVPKKVTDVSWDPNIVIYRTRKEVQNFYKVRLDGTKDLFRVDDLPGGRKIKERI